MYAIYNNDDNNYNLLDCKSFCLHIVLPLPAKFCECTLHNYKVNIIVNNYRQHN